LKTPPAPSKHPAAPAKKRVRLPPQEREQQIVAGALRYFSEHGFGGDTRSLAEDLGVTQSLLFRYFPSKDALIERVYREIYVSRWNPYWELLIADRGKPLKQRMVEFFKDYARTTLDRDWIRIFFFAGLKGSEMNKQFLAMVRERILLVICREMRAEFRLPPAEELPISDYEVELIFGIIGRMVYFGVRKWIYQTPVPDNVEQHIEATIEVFFEGVEQTLQRHLSQQGALAAGGRRKAVAGRKPAK
jgi:AcrR family transcriptional regulator